MAIKKIDMSAEYKYVSLEDTAIDKELSDLEKYKKDMNVKHLSFKEGEYPTYFILKNFSRKQFANLITGALELDFKTGQMVPKDGSNAIGMIYDVFNMGCKEVEENSKRSKINPEELEISVVQEISEALTKLAQLNIDEKK